MKRCNKCNIDFNTDRKSCPFCRSILEEVTESNHQPYPKYQEMSKKKRIVEKIFIFLSLIAVIVSIVSNYYDYVAGHTYQWSAVVSIGNK